MTGGSPGPSRSRVRVHQAGGTEMEIPHKAKRGDHEYVDAHDPKQCQAGYLPKRVYEAEHAAIKQRREYIKDNGKGDRTAFPSFTGLALSGGGIRSASFGLGGLHALNAYCGIEGIDYLSTVSGGAYIGCSLTAATQEPLAGQNARSRKNSRDVADEEQISIHQCRQFQRYRFRSAHKGFFQLSNSAWCLGRRHGAWDYRPRACRQRHYYLTDPVVLRLDYTLHSSDSGVVARAEDSCLEFLQFNRRARNAGVARLLVHSDPHRVQLFLSNRLGALYVGKPWVQCDTSRRMGGRFENLLHRDVDRRVD
jgi:hypothetical protein